MQLSHDSGLWPAGVIFCAFFTFAAMACAGTYSGGNGDPNDPYQIWTVEDWQAFVNEDPNDIFICDKCFILMEDLDLQNVTLKPFCNPYLDRGFEGVFEGNGHIIRNAVLNLQTMDYVGLFGKIGPGGQIRNLGVENITVTGGNYSNYIGGLCGFSSGVVSNCYVTGTITGRDGSIYLGGLTGDNSGTIRDCHVVVDISGGDYIRYVGNVCGRNLGNINNCYASGTLMGVGESYYLGGLLGGNFGTISDCHATGKVIGGTQSGYLGGLCGINEIIHGTDMRGTIMNCSATGTVIGGTHSSFLGGLCGRNYYGTITTVRLSKVEFAITS